MSDKNPTPQQDDDLPYDIVGKPDAKTLALFSEMMKSVKSTLGTIWYWAYVLHPEGTEQKEFDNLDDAVEFCGTYPRMIAFKVVRQWDNFTQVDNNYDQERQKWNDRWARDFLSTLDHLSPSWKPMPRYEDDDDDEELEMV